MGLGRLMPTDAHMTAYTLNDVFLYSNARHSFEFPFDETVSIGEEATSVGYFVIRNHCREQRRQR